LNGACLPPSAYGLENIYTSLWHKANYIPRKNCCGAGFRKQDFRIIIIFQDGGDEAFGFNYAPNSRAGHEAFARQMQAKALEQG
jgi:hypothetical protein